MEGKYELWSVKRLNWLFSLFADQLYEMVFAVRTLAVKKLFCERDTMEWQIITVSITCRLMEF